jgi:hypothetical protein
MDVQFVASVAPIVRDADAARSLYRDALGPDHRPPVEPRRVARRRLLYPVVPRHGGQLNLILKSIGF